MQRLEVSGAVRLIYRSFGVKLLNIFRLLDLRTPLMSVDTCQRLAGTFCLLLPGINFVQGAQH